MKQLTLNLESMKKVFNTPEVKSLVNAWLMQKAFSEIMREKVNQVYSEILSEIPIYDDTRLKFKRFKDHPITRITNVNDMYLSEDEFSCKRIYDEANKKLRALGIKPDSMEDDFCPALVAESDLTDIEHEIIKITGNPFNITVDKLLMHGSESYHKWIDLAVKAIISLPDFKNPLEVI